MAIMKLRTTEPAPNRDTRRSIEAAGFELETIEETLEPELRPR